MLRDNQKISSYPLPAKGGTPPILRGECHADSIQRCTSIAFNVERQLHSMLYVSQIVYGISS